jgi:antitoxin ParD1/3/4
MNVLLPPELAQLVQEKIDSGRYSSASEVVREALRLLEQKEEQHAVRLQQLRSRIDKGLAEADCGEGVDGDTFIQGLIDDLDSRDAKRNAG